MINVAVIGCGYWGPNYVRIFNEISSSTTHICCDLDENRLERLKKIYPQVNVTSSLLNVLNDDKVDAICVSTPASAHYEIVKQGLLHEKHVLVEKPFTLSVKEGEELINISKEVNKILMVGHVYLYHPAIIWMKRYITNNMKKLYYLYSIRTGLGPVRTDVNAMWDLAPHDISLFLHITKTMPLVVSANGASYLQKNIEDIVVLTMRFPNNVFGYIHSSWLDPYKSRKMTIVGSEKMVVFDETIPHESIKIHDKGFQKHDPKTYGEFLTNKRSGDVTIPKISSDEPLKNQCYDFINAIKNDGNPLANYKLGLNVIRILEAAEKSLKNDGTTIKLNPLNQHI